MSRIGSSGQSRVVARAVWRRAVPLLAVLFVGALLVPVMMPRSAANLAAQTSVAVPHYDHVFVVLEENHGYSAIIGSSQAPYLNQLASANGLATNYDAVAHPSLPNYMALTGGVATSGGDCDSCTFSNRNISDSLAAQGLTWKAYEEGLGNQNVLTPFPGAAGGYDNHHDPFAHWADDNPARLADIVDYTHLAADLKSASTTPTLAFISPDVAHDMHSASVTAGDQWAQQNFPAIFNSPAWKTQHSLLAVVWDEGTGSVNQVAAILAASDGTISAGTKSSTHYTHYSLLHTLEVSWGLPTLTSADAGAAPMSDIFHGGSGSPPPSPSGTPGPSHSPHPTPTPSPSPPPGGGSACNLVSRGADPTGAKDSTSVLQSAVDSCTSVDIPAGRYRLSNNIHVTRAVVVRGAGPTSTFLIQTARKNIFEVTADGVTIEQVNLDTSAFASAPVLKDPDPGVLFSNGSHDTYSYITGKAGSGFGMRLVGPNPCYSFQRGGNVVDHIDMTTTGTGGFAAVDIDCQNGTRVSNIVIHGGILALFNDENTSLTGEEFWRGPRNMTCEPAWYVTGPSNHITVANVVSHAGKGVIGNRPKGPVTDITVTNQTITSGC